MKQLGMTQLINLVFGTGPWAQETGCAILEADTQRIKDVQIKDNKLVFDLEDGKLVLFDDGQCCCENRFMSTDDELADFRNAELTGFEVRDMDPLPDEWGEHEQQALLVNTTLGTFTVVTHNEHNGYYGGFSIVAKYEAYHGPL